MLVRRSSKITEPQTPAEEYVARNITYKLAYGVSVFKAVRYLRVEFNLHGTNIYFNVLNMIFIEKAYLRKRCTLLGSCPDDYKIASGQSRYRGDLRYSRPCNCYRS
jgi:hypothetical protein